jgi:hypothetical protein
MSLKSWTKSLLRKSLKGSHGRQPVRSRLTLGCLEDRFTPTIVWNPVRG